MHFVNAILNPSQDFFFSVQHSICFDFGGVLPGGILSLPGRMYFKTLPPPSHLTSGPKHFGREAHPTGDGQKFASKKP